MKLVTIGSINKDIVLSVDTIVKGGETITAYDQNEFLGGKGYNQAVAISKVFDNSIFYCNINKNDTDLIKIVQSQNFDSSYVNIVDSSTGTAFIQVDKQGENSIIICKNANGEIDVSKVETLFSKLNQNDIVVLQNEINDLDTITSLGKQYGLKVVFNPSPMNPKLISLLDNVDLLVVNQHELNEITGQSDLESSIAFMKETYKDKEILITLGSEGAMYISNTEEIKVDSIKTNVVDTTCAGDTFLGYFIGSYANGLPIKTCMEYASKAASICVSKAGASVSIPNKNEVL